MKEAMSIYISSELKAVVEQLAKEKQVSCSEAVSLCIESYFEKRTCDTELIYSQIHKQLEISKRIVNSINVQGELISSMAKYLVSNVLENEAIAENLRKQQEDVLFKKFINRTYQDLKKNHPGFITNMVLDIYSDMNFEDEDK